MKPPEFFDSLMTGNRPDIDACIGALGGLLPLLEGFAATPQDPEWHAEGDVRVHTGMVLEELYRSFDLHDSDPEAAPMDAASRRVRILGALLHDIAKPLCTRPREIRGVMRITALHHEERGRSWLATRLVDQGLPWPELQRVLGCVGSHHHPKGLVLKERGAGEFRRVARRADLDDLWWVERADMLGRACPDRADQVDLVDMFRIDAEAHAPAGWLEAGMALFTAAMPGRPAAAVDRAFGEALRALQDGRIQSFEEGLFHAHRTPDDPPELVVLVGPSGSGKSTFAETVLSRPEWRHDIVSLDDLREEIAGDRRDQHSNGQVRQEARARLKAALRPGRRVVWDATSLRREFREAVISTGYDYGALTTIVAFQQPIRAYHARNRARPHAVPPRVLDDQLDGLEWPEADEAHRLLVLDGAGRARGGAGFCQGLPWGLELA